MDRRSPATAGSGALVEDGLDVRQAIRLGFQGMERHFMTQSGQLLRKPYNRVRRTRVQAMDVGDHMVDSKGSLVCRLAHMLHRVRWYAPRSLCPATETT